MNLCDIFMVLKRSPNRVIGHMIDDVDERLVVNTLLLPLYLCNKKKKKRKVESEKECKPHSRAEPITTEKRHAEAERDIETEDALLPDLS